MARPSAQDYGEFYHTYVSMVPENDILDAFSNQTAVTLQFLDAIPEDKQNHAYATGKWTIRQVLQHITDAERVFAYRALRFARKDHTPLAGFDENGFADAARVEHRDWVDMIEEFQMVRLSSEHLFRSLNEEEMQRKGMASNTPVTVLSLGYIIIGHALHHQRVIRERYL
ncbi:DinB family protein [Chitinophaga sp. XS-30]|uniref:DinB family protein n=1 Tax=Chitinophaga sp. XS-30 TaxID=2604421 RepID=UPI0011DC9FDA|nr:DinB family protein [Chitinophaga sp. XS-30]QEH43330.1 DinB family protein [Chitinophaga sp. XS-30]